MNIDEVIYQLQDWRNKHGNREVRLRDTSYVDGTPQDVGIEAVLFESMDHEPYVVIT